MDQIVATILLYSSHTEVKTYHVGLLHDLREELSFEQPRAVFTKAYMNRGWSGKVRLFKNKRCAAGLSNRVLAIARKWLPEDRIQIVDYRPTYDYSTTRFVGTLRQEYQVPAIEAALKAKQGVIWAPPRAGKTVIAAGMIAARFMPPTLFIVERLVLLQQTVDALQSRLPDVKVGRVGGGTCDIQDITVCTIQTLLMAYKKDLDENKLSLKIEGLEDEKEAVTESDAEKIRALNCSAKMVITDECHHSRAPSYEYVLSKQTTREYCIGLSGTPWVTVDNAKRWRQEIHTGQNLLLEAAMGSIIYQVPYETLLELGYLVPPICYFIRIPKMRGLSNKPYQTVYAEYITDPDAPRNRILAVAANNFIAKNRTVLITVGRIAHGEALQKLIPGSTWLHGADPEKVRRDALQLLNSRQSSCIISTLLGEGVDIPELDVVINAEGGYSSQRLLQRQRSMTSNGKKEVCIYVDCLDSVKYLVKHSQYRLDLLSHIPGFTVKIIDPPEDAK